MSNKKVLIVEDDADVRLGYHVLLKASHYETFLAIDGVSAVSEALKHQPDLMILDLGLPAGDGFKVLEWFRTNTYLAVIPIIVVSARDFHGNEQRALKAGAKAYLQKPWNDKELLDMIGKLLAPSEVSVPHVTDLASTGPTWVIEGMETGLEETDVQWDEAIFGVKPDAKVTTGPMAERRSGRT